MSRLSREWPEDPEVWDNPIRLLPESPRCLCSHALSGHYRDRKGRDVCGIAACGCIKPRPKENP